MSARPSMPVLGLPPQEPPPSKGLPKTAEASLEQRCSSPHVDSSCLPPCACLKSSQDLIPLSAPWSALGEADILSADRIWTKIAIISTEVRMLPNDDPTADPVCDCGSHIGPAWARRDVRADRNSSCGYCWNENQHGSCCLENKDFGDDKEGLLLELYQPISSNLQGRPQRWLAKGELSKDTKSPHLVRPRAFPTSSSADPGSYRHLSTLALSPATSNRKTPHKWATTQAGGWL